VELFENENSLTRTKHTKQPMTHYYYCCHAMLLLVPLGGY
jgi:hypothetical protein